MNKSKASMLPALIPLAGLGFLIYVIAFKVFPYELGVKKPKFQAGQCVSEFDEFGEANSTYKILAVGKARYQYVHFHRQYNDTYRTSGTKFTQKFWMSDDYGTAIPCPESIIGLD